MKFPTSKAFKVAPSFFAFSASKISLLFTGFPWTLPAAFWCNQQDLKMSWKQAPMSPRKPKVQQQSWEGTPTINLFEPNREFYDSSPNVPLASISVSQVRKSPTAPTRKINYNKYYLPNHQTSDPGTYYGNTATTALRSPKSPREQTFEFELSSPPQQTRSPLKSVGSNRRYYEESPQESPARATLTSHRKYEFGAVSPKFDNPGMFFFCFMTKYCPALVFSFLAKEVHHSSKKTFSFHLQARKNLNISLQQRRRPNLTTLK